jgi:hypothetical protein
MTKQLHDAQQSHLPASLPASSPDELQQQSFSSPSASQPVAEHQREESAEAIPCKNSLEGLLKSPVWVIQKIETNQHLWREGVFLLLWGLGFHALYGFAVALFGGWDAAFMTIIKAPLIAVCALALCLPVSIFFRVLAVFVLPIRRPLP